MQKWNPGNLPAVRSTTEKPELIDQAADYDIPRLWCARDVYGKPSAIFRALTDGERQLIEHRRDELTLGCAPFTPAEQDRAIKAIGRMLNGFRSMRHDNETAAVIGLDGLRHVLAPYPLWAIEQGCLLIHGGGASLDGKRLSDVYPPNDAQVRRVVAETVNWYIEKRDAAVALLAAPIELRLLEERRPTGAELKAKYGPNFGMESAAAAFLEAQAPERLRIATSYTAEDLERLASHLERKVASGAGA